MTGDELREIRKGLGLSMKQASEYSGTPYRTWQDWEWGKRRVPGIAAAWIKLYAQKEAETLLRAAWEQYDKARNQ